MSEDLKEAIDALVAALKSDDGYRMGWQANIAMAVYDAARLRGIEDDRLHEACNAGADNFLRLLTFVRETK